MKSSMNSLSGKALGRLLKGNDFPFRADSEECNGSLENRGGITHGSVQSYHQFLAENLFNNTVVYEIGK